MNVQMYPNNMFTVLPCNVSYLLCVSFQTKRQGFNDSGNAVVIVQCEKACLYGSEKNSEYTDTKI